MNTTTDLLPHQIPAVEKMLPTRIGALLMEMGTGKSRTAIELVKRRQDRIDTVLWFCPVALKATIRYEIAKHTDCPDDAIHVFSDKTRQRNTPQALWHIIGIESMSASDRVALAAYHLITPQTMVIVDESSYIKGHDALRTRRITRYAEAARYRLILTGTPISQGIVDLYAQMRFLSPDILGYPSFYSFAANHLEYDDEHPDLIVRSHNIPYLTAKIAPYVYQVTKAECLTLPPKLYETRTFHMTPEQREAYDFAKQEILSASDDETSRMHSIVIFRLFNTLQQIVCGFWHAPQPDGTRRTRTFAHPRIGVLLNIVRQIPAEEKIIIWCKYRQDIHAIVDALYYQYGADAIAQFHGGLNEAKRAVQLAHFRGAARFLVATQSCGGHGLTLNEACYVIYYNNTFKYAERLQSEDRCHRIGQERTTTYIDIQCDASIDDRIAQALATKGNAVEIFRDEVNKAKGQRRKRLIENL